MEQPTIQKAVSKGTIAKAANEPTFFVNVATVGASPEEFVIHFGLRDPGNPTETSGVITVFMTPGHAKRLTSGLVAGVKAYEANFGEIRENPEDMMTPEARKRVGLPQK